MPSNQPLREVVDRTDDDANLIFNMTVEQARSTVSRGDVVGVRAIEGVFALVGREGSTVRLARSLSVPLRYFIAKRSDGPVLVVAHRIDAIADWLQSQGLADQFHPTYTRMVPAHHITEIALLGCPDPSPTYRRYFAPRHNTLPADLNEIGCRYIAAASNAVTGWLRSIPADAPIGVCFSGGIDSGAVFLVTYHCLLSLGMSPSRLKAFTLWVDKGGEDVDQARRFLDALGLSLFLETVEAHADDIDLESAVRTMEDYKPLDVQAGAMGNALLRGIRRRYPDWVHLIDGDGGDENLKDYPIEENPELTIRSVLNNRLLYHEGWGVDSAKHSLVYTGGLSRGCTRTFAPASRFGFRGFSPFTLPDVIEVAEGIPFVELTDWRHDRLYDLKGQVVSRGVEAVTGLKMPVFPKRRFQHGVLSDREFASRFPDSPRSYRKAFQAAFDA